MSDCFHRQDATIVKQYVAELREYKITYHLNPACEYITDGLGALAQHSLSAKVCEKQTVSFAAYGIGIVSNGCPTQDPNKVVVFSKFINCLDLLFLECSMLYECNIVKGDTCTPLKLIDRMHSDRNVQKPRWICSFVHDDWCRCSWY